MTRKRKGYFGYVDVFYKRRHETVLRNLQTALGHDFIIMNIELIITLCIQYQRASDIVLLEPPHAMSKICHLSFAKVGEDNVNYLGINQCYVH